MTTNADVLPGADGERAQPAHKTGLTIDRIVLFFAGSVVLLSLILSVFSSQWWLLLALFVAVNLMQAAISGFCPLAKILRFLGFKPGAAF